MGVVSAMLRFADLDLEATSWLKTTGADILTFAAYVAIIGYFVWDSKRAKPQKE